METVRTSMGQTAPKPERGFFMPKNTFSPVDRLRSPNYKKDRRGFIFPFQMEQCEASLQTSPLGGDLTAVIGSSALHPLRAESRLETNPCTELGHPGSPLEHSNCLLPVGVNTLNGGLPHAGHQNRQKAVQISQSGDGECRNHPRGSETLAPESGPVAVSAAFKGTESHPGLLDHQLQANPPKAADHADDYPLRPVESLEQPLASQKTWVIPLFRPDPIILGYWKEVISIEEDAEIYEVEFMEAA
jgi:hypothetical protein